MSASPITQQQQDELLQGAQQRMSAWMGRRQEALETGLDAFKRMSACKTPIEIAVIYGEWLSGSMTRILADLEDGQAHAIKMVEHAHKASKTMFAPPEVAAAESSQPAVPSVVSEEPPAHRQLREAA